MANPFLEELKKKRVLYGLIISLFSTVALIIGFVGIADLIREDITWLPVAGLTYLMLFWWFVSIEVRLRKNGKK